MARAPIAIQKPGPYHLQPLSANDTINAPSPANPPVQCGVRAAAPRLPNRSAGVRGAPGMAHGAYPLPMPK
jgi:hypothetical protein